MVMGDLPALRQQQLPVKVIVYKNEALAEIIPHFPQ
jgi:thiamine pyrophosphate-dependent acetolactate synthase large subunit-like protein